MTKKELSQLRYLNKEIELLKQQIAEAEYKAEMHMTSDTVTGSNPEWPYQKRSFRIEGIDVAGHEKQVKRLKNKLKRRIMKLMRTKEKLEKYIENIPDSELRMIFALRYINGLSWQQIAAHLGFEGDGSTQRKKHDRYLKLSRNS